MIPQVQHSTADQAPIYVAIGGWNSCVADPRIPGAPNPYGMNLNKMFSVFIKQMESRSQGQAVKSIIACHSADTSNVKFVQSTSPANLQIGSHPELYQVIASFSQSTNSPVVLLGHSYGGSYVMQAAMAIPTQVRINHLVTIDPISPVHCPADVFIKATGSRISQILGKDSTERSKYLGCQEAPREFNQAQLQQIRERVGWWQNYYQSDLLSILRSAAIAPACNQSVSHKSISTFINGHIAMGMYEHLWADITYLLTNPLPSACTDRQL
jgi:hypothetical protein